MLPLLDGMQTIPVFAYLLPILPVRVRTHLRARRHHHLRDAADGARHPAGARHGVAEVVEFGRMAGCTRRQLIFRVMMPVRARAAGGVTGDHALPQHGDIASMIGAGGLGFDVLARSGAQYRQGWKPAWRSSCSPSR